MTTLTPTSAPAQPLSLAEATLELARDIGALAHRLASLEAPRSTRK